MINSFYLSLFRNTFLYTRFPKRLNGAVFPGFDQEREMAVCKNEQILFFVLHSDPRTARKKPPGLSEFSAKFVEHRRLVSF